MSWPSFSPQYNNQELSNNLHLPYENEIGVEMNLRLVHLPGENERDPVHVIERKFESEVVIRKETDIATDPETDIVIGIDEIVAKERKNRTDNVTEAEAVTGNEDVGMIVAKNYFFFFIITFSLTKHGSHIRLYDSDNPCAAVITFIVMEYSLSLINASVIAEVKRIFTCFRKKYLYLNLQSFWIKVSRFKMVEFLLAAS